MSEENQNHTEQKKSNSGIWILITIIALLGAGALGWMYSKESKAYKSCQTTNAQLELEMQSMNEALSGYIDGSTMDLKKDFQMMLDTYDKLIEKDASKSDSLQAQKDSISVLLAQLSDTKNRSYYQINKLKKRNEQLRQIMNRYLITIDSLNTLNIDLTSRLDKTSSELNLTQAERDELRKQNDQNAELLTKGAKLNAFNFVSEALRYQTFGGDTKSVNRAARAEVLSCTFTIGENKIARTGNKTIYMQITDPNGQVIYKRPSDVTQIAGSEILYTGKREINYQGQLIDMTIVYNLEGKEIASGNYVLKVYADGALVGKDTFTLK
jgi:flagellar basal body-associated protein FliL